MARCPACSGSASPTGETHAWKDRKYAMNRCPSCDLVFADPCENPGAEFYEAIGDYSERVETGKGVILQPSQKLFLNRPPLGKTLLDVGCGTGEVLAAARERGYSVAGVEFNTKFVAFCRDVRGLDVQPLTPGELAKTGRRFDVVSFFETLEHNHPGEFMADVKRLLAPGGWIALSVPNRDRTYETIREGDDPPHHLCRWTRSSLTKFLEKEGFSIVELAAPVDRQNLAFQLREMTSLGLARKVASDPAALVKPSTAAPPASLKESLLRKAVKAKELTLEAAAWPWYWKLRLARGGYDGPNLFCLARLR